MAVGRWPLRAALATGLTAAAAWLFIPPNIGEHPLQLPSVRAEIYTIAAVMFAVVWSADALIASARRRPDPLRRTAIISFITGLFCAAFALSWALALFSVLLAPAGVAAGSITWRKETAHGEPHSGLNITGLILNGFALLVAIFQASLAIYLAGR